MQADFLDAHERHLYDAECLFLAKRWANADHLYGMAAECGLKVLIEILKQGPLDPRNDYLHIMDAKKPSNAWSRYQAYLSGHTLATKLPLPQSNPFQQWDVSDRYAHQSHFNQARAQAHQGGANLVRALIQRAKKEGVIT